MCLPPVLEARSRRVSGGRLLLETLRENERILVYSILNIFYSNRCLCSYFSLFILFLGCLFSFSLISFATYSLYYFRNKMSKESQGWMEFSRAPIPSSLRANNLLTPHPLAGTETIPLRTWCCPQQLQPALLPTPSACASPGSVKKDW